MNLAKTPNNSWKTLTCTQEALFLNIIKNNVLQVHSKRQKLVLRTKLPRLTHLFNLRTPDLLRKLALQCIKFWIKW